MLWAHVAVLCCVAAAVAFLSVPYVAAAAAAVPPATAVRVRLEWDLGVGRVGCSLQAMRLETCRGWFGC